MAVFNGLAILSGPVHTVVRRMDPGPWCSVALGLQVYEQSQSDLICSFQFRCHHHQTTMARSKKEKPAKKSAIHDVVTRDYTIRTNLSLLPLLTSPPDMHKKVYGVSFKKRAPTAIKAIKEFAKLHMVSPPLLSQRLISVGNK